MAMIEEPRVPSVFEGRAVSLPGFAKRGWVVAVWNRMASALLVLWFSVTLTFVALQVVPGDPLMVILGPGASATPEIVAELRREFGLDRSLGERYVAYLRGLTHGDLGISYHTKQPVAAAIGGQLGSSAALTASSLAVAWVFATLSVALTARRGRFVVAGARSLEVVVAALPNFWLGLILVTVFAFTLHWFPSAGGGGLVGLVLPSLALGIPLYGFLAQVMRQAFDDALGQPFALSSRARGTRDIVVRLRHALRHAVLPGIALSNWAIGWLIGGSVAIERIFARQGLGTLILTAVSRRDYPIIMGVVVLIAALYVFVNAVTDGLTALVDPRLRRQA